MEINIKEATQLYISKVKSIGLCSGHETMADLEIETYHIFLIILENNKKTFSATSTVPLDEFNNSLNSFSKFALLAKQQYQDPKQKLIEQEKERVSKNKKKLMKKIAKL